MPCSVLGRSPTCLHPDASRNSIFQLIEMLKSQVAIAGAIRRRNKSLISLLESRFSFAGDLRTEAPCRWRTSPCAMWTESLRRQRAAPTSRRKGPKKLCPFFERELPTKPEVHHVNEDLPHSCLDHEPCRMLMFCVWHALLSISDQLHGASDSFVLHRKIRTQSHLQQRFFLSISESIDVVGMWQRRATCSRKPQTWSHAMRTSQNRPDWMDCAHPQPKSILAIVSTLLPSDAQLPMHYATTIVHEQLKHTCKPHGTCIL